MVEKQKIHYRALYIRYGQFLPQEVVNKLPDDKKEGIWQKLGPSPNSKVNDNVQLEAV